MLSRDDYIREIERCEGNVRKTAARLNMSRITLYAHIKKFGLWPAINHARAERLKNTPKNENIARARAVLKN